MTYRRREDSHRAIGGHDVTEAFARSIASRGLGRTVSDRFGEPAAAGRRARNRSMNDVLSLPATKSGSLRIRRCSGNGGLDAFDDRHLERAPHARDRFRAGRGRAR